MPLLWLLHSLPPLFLSPLCSFSLTRVTWFLVKIHCHCVLKPRVLFQLVCVCVFFRDSTALIRSGSYTRRRWDDDLKNSDGSTSSNRTSSYQRRSVSSPVSTFAQLGKRTTDVGVHTIELALGHQRFMSVHALLHGSSCRENHANQSQRFSPWSLTAWLYLSCQVLVPLSLNH